MDTPHAREDFAEAAPAALPEERSAVLVWSRELVSYDFGAGHPMAPVRLALTLELMDELGVTEQLERVDAPVASDEELTTVHEPEYVAAVREAQETGEPNTARGLGDEDIPVFGAVHDAAARIAGATLAAADAIISGRTRRAVSPAGGMHHAMATRAAGFCVYNDVALAAVRLRSAGLRVAYVDLDAHHGDGVERALWDDPDALTISIHQHPKTLFPGTGFAQDVGGPDAKGSAVNVALPPGTRDAAWLRAVEAILDPLLAEFAPDVLLTQHGADCHLEDPLANLAISVDAQRAAAVYCADLAERHAGGRWLATGGGGYAVATVVPRAWTHLAAIVAGAPLALPTPIPANFAAHVERLTGARIPAMMSDADVPELADSIAADVAGVAQFWQGYDPADDVDRAIFATRQAVFPWHGLDPVTA